MAYNKAEAQAVGREFVQLFIGAANGIDNADALALIEAINALSQGADEFSTDAPRAVLDAISGASSEAADTIAKPEVP